MEGGILFELFMEGLLCYLLYCVDGIVVYLMLSIDFVFLVLLYNFKYNYVLYKCVLFIYFCILVVLYVDLVKCLVIKIIGDDIYMVVVDFGFKEILVVDEIVCNVGEWLGIVFEDMEILFFIICVMVVLLLLFGMVMW